MLRDLIKSELLSNKLYEITPEVAENISELEKLTNVNVDELERYVRTLDDDLKIALSLCERAFEKDPDVTIEKDLSLMEIKSLALFQRGYLRYLIGQYRDAIQFFESSLQYSPSQATYYNIGVCYERMKGVFSDRTKDAITAYEKCIEIDPDSEIAIKAGKQLARLGKLT